MIQRKQIGAALLMAILIVALVSTTVVFVAGQQSLWTQQAGHLAARGQTTALARAAIDWARGVLAQDARDGKIDHPGEAWAKRLNALPVEQGDLSGAIADQHALFNLNNLVRNGRDSEADIALFQRLLAQLQLPSELINSLLDWIDQDNTLHHPGGAEDNDYLRGDAPYRTANRPLLSVDELYRVRGFNRANIERLRPFVTALPEYSAINVNSAPREILSALLPELAETDISTALENRKNAFFKSKQDFRARLPKAAPALGDALYDVASRYFLAVVQVRSRDADSAVAALLVRPVAGGWPDIVWQRQLTE